MNRTQKIIFALLVIAFGLWLARGVPVKKQSFTPPPAQMVFEQKPGPAKEPDALQLQVDAINAELQAKRERGEPTVKGAPPPPTPP